MTKVMITEQSLSDIGDAIRDRLDVETTYQPAQMAAAIMSIPVYSFDSVPTENSDNILTSGVIYTALAAKADSTDTYTKTEVDSLLSSKEDTLTFDSTPTQGSTNPVTSNGIYQAIADASTTVDAALSDTSENPVQNKIVKAALDTKQGTLTFDSTPTANSTNPVTSGGVKTALDTKQDSLTFDSTPTASSNNPVKSGGVYTAIKTVSDALDDLGLSVVDGRLCITYGG